MTHVLGATKRGPRSNVSQPDMSKGAKGTGSQLDLKIYPQGTISKGKQSSNQHFLGERLVFGGGTIALWGNCRDLRGKQANSFILDHRLLLKVMSRLVILICHRQPLRKCQREWSQRTLPGTLHPWNQLNLGTSSFIYESEQHIWISLYGTLWSMFETRNWHTTSPRMHLCIAGRCIDSFTSWGAEGNAKRGSSATQALPFQELLAAGRDTTKTMVWLYSSTLENPNSAGKILTGHGLGMCGSASHASAALEQLNRSCESLFFLCKFNLPDWSALHDMPLHKRLHNSQPLRAARRSGKPAGG